MSRPRWGLALLLLAGAGCKRSREVAAARDAGAVTSARRDVLCVEQQDTDCVWCADKDGEASSLDPDQRPSLCQPKDPENCVEFCSAVTADCALPWFKGTSCLMSSETEFRRAMFSRETADRPEITVAGRVVDESGKRVEGAQIRVWLSRGSVLTSLADEVSGKDGLFHLRLKLGPWTYAVRFTAPGLASEIVDRLPLDKVERQPAGSATPRTFRMGAEHVVKGRVVDAATGNPVSGALVQAVRNPDDVIESGESRTTDDGAFTVGGLEPRRYFLRVAKFGWRLVRESAKASIAAPAARVTLKVSRANIIQGVVVDSDGEPEADATVVALPSGAPGATDFSVDWKTDAAGHFAQDHFAVGTYYLWARRRDMLVYPPEKIELAENQDVDVRLTLGHKGARVSGQVMGKDGYSWGAGQARVVLLSRSPLAFPKRAVGEIDSQGRFIITGVLPGRYELSVKAATRTLAIVQGPREVDVPVDPDSSVPLKEPLIVRPLAEE